MPKLNAKMIENLKPPAKGRLEITDTEARGLKFRLTARGAATWSLMVNVGGEKRRFTLGEYPALGLSAARAAAVNLRSEALKGHDPIREKRAERARRASLMTLGAVLDLYLDAHVRPNLRTARERELQLRNALGPHLDKPAEELARRDLHAAIDAKTRTGRVEANRVRAALLHFTKWAAGREYLPTDVGAGIPKPTKEVPRDRVLSIEEVRAIYAACGELGDPFGPLLRVLVLTAQRLGDVAGMRFGELDLDTASWRIPSARTKNATAHIVHLSEPALAILRERVTIRAAVAAGEGRRLRVDDLVFPGRHGSAPSGFSKLNHRLNALVTAHRIAAGTDPDAAPLEHWTRHDLRTAFATAMAEAGESEGVVDRILNHVAKASAASAVSRVYNRAQLLEQRATALDRWAQMVTGQRGDVVALARGRRATA